MNENLRESKMISNAPFFLWATLGYALFYVICLYDNGSGITFPVFTLGTLIYFILCMKRLDVRLKPYSVFYMICIELLGLSTCLTDSYVIIFLNKCSIFFLVIVFLLHNFYENRHWNFIDHIKAYFETIFISIGYIYKPFSHLVHYRKQRVVMSGEKKNNKLIYIILGFVISIPLVAVVLLLLVSADAVFGHIFVNMFENINLFELIGDSVLSSILFVAVFFFTYMLVSFLSNYNVNGVKKEKEGGEPLIAITVSAVLSFVYVIFCGIQIIYLFIGSKTTLSLPDNMTYAEYARQGFFQLLFVCIINLILVLVGIYFFKESKILKTLLCIITCCTFIMIASSAMRMLLYIQYKYLTFLRVFVLWALLVITFVMIGAIITIFKKNFNFFKYSTIVVTCLYLILSFARVDYFIAKVNTDNMFEETQYEFFRDTEVYDDYSYLCGNLSYDAAPIILKYGEKPKDGESFWSYNSYRERYIERLSHQTEKMGIRDFNISRFIAKQCIE